MSRLAEGGRVCGGLELDVAQLGDGMDDDLGEAGRKGAPVMELGSSRLDCAGLENKRYGMLSC